LIIITGDINIRLDRPSDAHSVQFNSLLASFGFFQHVNAPTHNRGGTLITLDNLQIELPRVRSVGLSDHHLVQWSVMMRRPDVTFRTAVHRDWKAFDLASYTADLSASPLCADHGDWQDTDVDLMIKLYDETIGEFVDRHAPMKKAALRDRPSFGWFDDECRQKSLQLEPLRGAIS
jgi:hypothetical protein